MDGTPPTLTTAFAFSVNSATGIALEYNETLDANSIPDPSAFEVKVQNNSVAVSSVTRHTTDTTLALLLSENPRPGDTITISYTVPRTNPIQDEAGNDAAAFSEQAVTNNLAVTAPDAPGNLAATPGTVADTMVLTWDTPWANGDAITRFRVRYVQGTTAGGTWADILNSDADTTTHMVTGLTAGTQYTFEVRAVNGIGNGAPATVTQTTATPTWELTLTDNGNAVTQLVEGGASATATVSITNAVTFSTAQTVTLEWDGKCAGHGESDPGLRRGERDHHPPRHLQRHPRHQRARPRWRGGIRPSRVPRLCGGGTARTRSAASTSP